MKSLLWFSLLTFVSSSCSPAWRISRQLRAESAYNDHFTGVALYDPVRKKALIQHNADKPFTPASNTKLFSFYAGILSLRDSLPALQYQIQGDSLIFWGTGNPLLLHPDLPDSTALAFLRSRPEQLFFSGANYSGPRFGPGWAWDDYNDYYSAELTPLPIFGNVVRFVNRGKADGVRPQISVSPRRFADSVRIVAEGKLLAGIRRSEFDNQFFRSSDTRPFRQDVPFRWSPELAARLLSDTLHRPVGVLNWPVSANARLLRGFPTDSLYKRMLLVSDNQFAEQIFFMISAERRTDRLDPVGEVRRMADSLQYPVTSAKWVDGSGLSRYNLFTPNVLIDLLAKLYARVPRQRLFALLPAAGQSGAFQSRTKPGQPYIFAKSGSMSGVYNLSGYLLTRQNKLLYFSIMHNNFSQPVSEMRRRTMMLLKQIHEQL